MMESPFVRGSADDCFSFLKYTAPEDANQIPMTGFREEILRFFLQDARPEGAENK